MRSSAQFRWYFYLPSSVVWSSSDVLPVSGHKRSRRNIQKRFFVWITSTCEGPRDTRPQSGATCTARSRCVSWRRARFWEIWSTCLTCAHTARQLFVWRQQKYLSWPQKTSIDSLTRRRRLLPEYSKWWSVIKCLLFMDIFILKRTS